MVARAQVPCNECGLPMYASLTKPLLTVAASLQPGHAAESPVMGAAAVSRDHQVPSYPHLDQIALGLIRYESSSAAKSRKNQMSRPLRQHVLSCAGLGDEDQPNGSEACRANIVRDGGAWYRAVQASMSAVYPQFILSYLRATYKSNLYASNPDALIDPNRGPFTAGSWDAVTVYRLDAGHVALLCPKLKAWHRHLHTNVRLRTHDLMLYAVPEEVELCK